MTNCASRSRWLFVLLLASSPGLFAGSWTNTGPVSKIIKAVSISPQDTNIVYAGAFGSGVYKSTNHGLSWVDQKVGLTNAYVRSILALSNTTVFCGTNDGVFKSTDGGATWALSLSTPFSVRSLAYDAAKTSLYGASFGAGLFKSTDQGVSWTSHTVTDVGQTLSHLWAVAVFGQDSLYVGGSLTDLTAGGALFRSVDGGVSWIQVQRALHIGAAVHAIAISPNSPSLSLIIGTGTKGVYKSTDGGTSWLDINGSGTINPPIDSAINAVAFSPGYRFAGSDIVGGFYARALNDITVGWVPGSGLPGASAAVSSIAINPANPTSLLLGTEGQGVYQSLNSGAGWVARNTGLLGVAARVIRRNGNGQIILGADFGDGIWISADQGNTWTKSTALPTSNAITAIGITNTPSVLYAGAYGTGVFKSTDAGITWTVTDSISLSHFVRALAVHPSNANLLYAGTGNGVYKTTNGGASWFTVNAGIPASTSIRSMALDPTSPNTLYAGTDSLFLYKTTDGGGSWTHITSANGFLPQDDFIRTITIDYASSAILYAGGDSGRIYKSTNAGTSWNLLTPLASTHTVRSILIHPTNHAVFFAGSFGEGVFMSADSGSHWQPMNSGLTDQEIYTLESDQANPLMIYAGSGSTGVFKQAFTFTDHAPVLATIGNKAVLAGNQLQFALSATDSDLTIPVLSATGLPSGALFTDSLNGHGGFRWTPTLGQLGTHPVTFHASDGVLADSELVLVTVLDPSNSSSTDLPVLGSWNLLSVPVVASDFRKVALFSTASSPAFAYEGSYAIKETLRLGAGYWLKFRSAQSVTLAGATVNAETLAVSPGWNMIGSVSHAIPLSSLSPVLPVVRLSSVFAYGGPSGYVTSDSIRPGRGYWIKVNQAGSVVLSSSPGQTPVAARVPESAPESPEGIISFTAAGGAAKALSLLPAWSDGEFSLPPVPPPGSFDVRFSATQSSGVRTPETGASLPVRISSPGGDLELAWDLPSGLGTWSFRLGGREYPLAGRGSVTLPFPQGVYAAELTHGTVASGESMLPSRIALAQNHPNPFNPSTTISYDIPFDASVKLAVYDLLGREVEQLFLGRAQVGSHTVTFDAGRFSSGVYYYTLEVTGGPVPGRTFRETKKMFLLK